MKEAGIPDKRQPFITFNAVDGYIMECILNVKIYAPNVCVKDCDSNFEVNLQSLDTCFILVHTYCLMQGSCFILVKRFTSPLESQPLNIE